MGPHTLNSRTKKHEQRLIGRSLTVSNPRPRERLRQRLGILDISIRQKWIVVYPWLTRLNYGPLKVLDAGCGAGHWSVELGQRHPDWQITGIDRDTEAIYKANELRDRTETTNAAFQPASFLTYSPPEPFDVVLSVASAHYLVEKGDGNRLFERIYSWLRPGGHLVLVGPRRRVDVPFSTALPWPRWHEVFTPEELDGYCQRCGLVPISIEGYVGRTGVMAKQLSLLSRPLNLITYPAQFVLHSFDRWDPPENGSPCALLLLVAKRPQITHHEFA